MSDHLSLANLNKSKQGYIADDGGTEFLSKKTKTPYRTQNHCSVATQSENFIPAFQASLYGDNRNGSV